MSQNSSIIDLNRKRAGMSYVNLMDYLNQINNKTNNNEEKNSSRKKMKSYCRNLPVLIKTNGLLNALCFIKGKSKIEKEKNEYSYIYDWINTWFHEIGYYDDQKDIIEKLLDLKNSEYYIYTKEAIEISNWYKRNAEAMIDDVDKNIRF